MELPKPHGYCRRCGFRRDLDTFRREWTGARVCADCWDPKNEQLSVRAVPENLALRNAQPEQADVFVEPADQLASTL